MRTVLASLVSTLQRLETADGCPTTMTPSCRGPFHGNPERCPAKCTGCMVITSGFSWSQSCLGRSARLAGNAEVSPIYLSTSATKFTPYFLPSLKDGQWSTCSDCCPADSGAMTVSTQLWMTCNIVAVWYSRCMQHAARKHEVRTSCFPACHLIADFVALGFTD